MCSWRGAVLLAAAGLCTLAVCLRVLPDLLVGTLEVTDDLPQLYIVLLGNLPPSFARPELLGDLVEGLARGLRKRVGNKQLAEAEFALLLLRFQGRRRDIQLL